MDVRRAVPINADVEVRVSAIPPRTADGPMLLDVRLYRRGVPGTALTPTAAGFHVPLHMADLVADAIRTTGRRAAEVAAVAPLAAIRSQPCPR
jgi:hypothetical protein